MKVQGAVSFLPLAVLSFAPVLPGQGLAASLGKGDGGAVVAAAGALESPVAAEVDALLRLIEAGWSADGPRGTAGELAFAVLGWWSMQDAAIGNGLYDRFESGRWQKIEGDLLWLASMGVGDGIGRAKRWIAKDKADWRRWGWTLLREVGADAGFVAACVEQALASDVEIDRRLGMQLIWEFEIASEAMTRRLEAMHASAEEEKTRWAATWALARGGGFRTQWMLGVREALADPAHKEWLDRQFERMVPAAAVRLVGDVARLGVEERLPALAWVGGHLHDASVRRALLALELDPVARRELAPHFARHALGEPDVLPFWLQCLADGPHLQRLACLGLAHLGKAAVPHLASIAKLLAVEPKKRGLQHHVRASAIHALGAIGTDAKQYIDPIAVFAGSDDEFVAAAAAWALPRLQGTAASGPWRPAADVRPRRFEGKQLIDLRKPDSAVLQAIATWPESARRLALPRLLVTCFDERPSPPPAVMAFGAGTRSAMEMLVAVDQAALVGLRSRHITEPETISWQRLGALRVEALRSIGPSAKVANHVLQWLAPRRPHLRQFVDTLR